MLNRFLYRFNKIIAICLILLFVFSCNTKDDVLTPCVPNGEENYDVLFSNISPCELYIGGVSIFLEYGCDNSAIVILNDDTATVENIVSISESGYYDLEIKNNVDVKKNSFVVIDETRGDAEWGLKPWIPLPFNRSDKIIGQVKLQYPRNQLLGLNFPVVIKTILNDSLYPNYSYINNKQGRTENLKQGIGSISMKASLLSSTLEINVGDQNHVLTTTNLLNTDTLTIEGIISSDLTILSNRIVLIKDDLFIEPNVLLNINPGCIILVKEAVTIYNNGSIVLLGNSDNPILFTCADNAAYWGGIVSLERGSDISAEEVFFLRSGYHNSGEFILGHAKRQGLFQLENSKLELKNCYMLDHIGQVFYPVNSEITMDDCLIQRAKTGGEFVRTKAIIRNTIFTDFPNDSDQYIDSDNDGLYIGENCEVEIHNCSFMYAKDDGLDSGTASLGEILITNSNFESCFHEGLALSSKEGLKTHIVRNSVFKNNGQGLELGFSSPEHAVFVENCLFTQNHIGLRYGDNYTWSSPNGILNVSNSQSIDNDIDIWNMVRTDCAPRLENMIFSNFIISQSSTQYPELKIME